LSRETRERERRDFMSRCWVMASCISTGRADQWEMEDEERAMAGDDVFGKG
jgi:hypothetical protein